PFADGQSLGTRPALLDPRGPCQTSLPSLLHWALQVKALASRVAQLSGERLSVHVFSACLAPAWGELLSENADGASVKLRVHAAHRSDIRLAVHALRETSSRLDCCYDWRQHMVATLLKWEIMAMTRARVVVFLDLDLEVLPQHSLRILHMLAGQQHAELQKIERLNAKDWMEVLRCVSSSNYTMLATPDHSSPVNAALMFVRPNLTLYHEGINVLRGAVGKPFDYMQGWESIGKPKAVLPPEDAAWWRLPHHLEMLDWNNWKFVGSSIDQGFFFYMTRLRHKRPQIGTDLRMSSCSRPSRDGISDAGPHTTFFYHYGAHGGWKPDRVASEWASKAVMKEHCDASLIGRAVHDRRQLESIGRVFSWIHRTLAALRDLLLAFQANEKSKLVHSSASGVTGHRYSRLNQTEAQMVHFQLETSMQNLEHAAACVERSLDRWLLSTRRSPRLNSKQFRTGRREQIVQSARVLEVVKKSDSFPRPISLRAAACSSCRWASYTATSRYKTEHMQT
ncbi:MAG: hypothetical protein SGPRY_013579, partial [Prymnesium sp.]